MPVKAKNNALLTLVEFLIINNTPVFDVANCTAKLEELYQQHLTQKQGVGEKKEKFAFELTFAPEPKLQGEKLKKAINDFHNYISFLFFLTTYAEGCPENGSCSIL